MSSNPRKELISIVLSFYNEGEVIPELVRRLRDVFKDLDYDHELVFVNDCSTDNSLDVLIEKSKGSEDIKILNTSRNFGHMPCIYAGLEATTGDAVIYMDADLQDPPELIPEMIKAWKSENDVEVVFTTRTHRDGEGFFKLWLTKWGYRILKFATEISIQENSGDFRLVSRKAANELLKFKEKMPFFRFLVAWIGFKQKQVFYRREERFAGKTHFSIFSRKVYTQFLEISLVPFSDKPMKISLLLGMLTSIFAFLYLVYILITRFGFGEHLPGWSPIMVTILGLGGVQFIVIGILGLYIASIHKEVKARPNCIIKERIGFPDSWCFQGPMGFEFKTYII